MLADESSFDTAFNLAFYGHEVGHQWWGNAVTVRGQAGAYLLSEAMAQYGSRITDRIDFDEGRVRGRLSLDASAGISLARAAAMMSLSLTPAGTVTAVQVGDAMDSDLAQSDSPIALMPARFAGPLSSTEPRA